MRQGYLVRHSVEQGRAGFVGSAALLRLSVGSPWATIEAPPQTQGVPWDVVKRKLQLVDIKVWMAVFVVFSFVCSGGFGIEDMIGGAGPGFALILLIALPFLWGLPQALVCSELGSARYPEDGGLYRWSRRALGEFMGFQTGWWWVLSIFVDSAVYIALTVDYAQSWFHLTNWERWILAVVLIAIFAYVNIRGLQLAAVGAR